MKVILRLLFVALQGVKYCDECFCLCVGPPACLNNHNPNFTKFSVHVTCGLDWSSFDNNTICSCNTEFPHNLTCKITTRNNKSLAVETNSA